MPRLDGYQATQKIKALLPSTRVLVLSVHSSPESRQKAAEAGADAFIEKGSPVSEIIQQIKSIEKTELNRRDTESAESSL
jgi:DNA-binding NarL/FixJ family response regulator